MDANLSQHSLHDIANMGMRATIGVIFIVHGLGKFNPGFAGFLTGVVAARIMTSQHDVSRNTGFTCVLCPSRRPYWEAYPIICRRPDREAYPVSMS